MSVYGTNDARRLGVDVSHRIFVGRDDGWKREEAGDLAALGGFDADPRGINLCLAEFDNSLLVLVVT